MQYKLIHKGGKLKANALRLANFSVLFLVLIFSISFSSASMKVGLDGSLNEVGINFDRTPVNISEFNVNSSLWWDTLDHGPLRSVSDILSSWITNDLFVERTGDTMTGNLEIDTNLTVDGFSFFNDAVDVDGTLTVFNMPNPGIRFQRDDATIGSTNTLGVVSFRGGDRDLGDGKPGAYIETTADGTWNGGSDNPSIFEIYVESDGIGNGLGLPVLKLNGTSMATTFKGDVLPRVTLDKNLGSNVLRWLGLYVGDISADGIEVSGDIVALGNITADTFYGSGASLTDLNVTGVINVTGDFSGYALNTSFLYGAGGIGGIDMRGDPWYFGGSDFQFAENVLVDGNVSATYFLGNGSQLTGLPETDLTGYAKYQFENNNFNGSGNFITTGDIEGEVLTVNKNGSVGDGLGVVFGIEGSDTGFGATNSPDTLFVRVDGPIIQDWFQGGVTDLSTFYADVVIEKTLTVGGIISQNGSTLDETYFRLNGDSVMAGNANFGGYNLDNVGDISQNEVLANVDTTNEVWVPNNYEGIQRWMESSVYGMGLRYNALANKLYLDRYNNNAVPTVLMAFDRATALVEVTGDLDVSGDLEIGGEFTIDEMSVNEIDLGANTITDGRLSGDWEVTGSLDAGNTNITGTLDAGDTTVTGALTVTGTEESDVMIYAGDSADVIDDDAEDAGIVRLYGGNGGDATDGGDSGEGGGVTIRGGDAGDAINANFRDYAYEGGDVGLLAGTGGDMSIAGALNIRDGGDGGNLALTSGFAGTYTQISGDFGGLAGASGDITVSTAQGGFSYGNSDQTSASTNTGGDSGDFLFYAQSAGGAQSAFNGNNLGGNGGDVTFIGGEGGIAQNSLTSNTGGNAGNLLFRSGRGGIGATANGINGAIDFEIGGTTGSAGTLVGTFLNDASGLLFGDNIAQIFGDSQDASIYWNGLNLIINPQLLTPGTQLQVLGDLNVTGTISNSLSHMHGLSTEVGVVSSVDTWYNVTFNASLGDAVKLEFIDNRTIIIDHDGHYVITFGMGFQDSSPSPNAHVGMRITKNGAEIPGSYIEQDTSKQNADIWSEHTTHVELSAGDELNMQYISSDTDVTIQQDDTYATQPFNAYGYLQEVIL